MRKFIAIAAAVFMAVGLSACANQVQAVPAATVIAEPVVVVPEETPVIDVPTALTVDDLGEDAPIAGDDSADIPAQVQLLGDSAPRAYEVTVGTVGNHEIIVTLYVQYDEFEEYPAELGFSPTAKRLTQAQAEEMLGDEQLIGLKCLIETYSTNQDHQIPFAFALSTPLSDMAPEHVNPELIPSNTWQLGGECFK